MRLTGCQSQGRTHFVPAAMPESTPMAESQNSEKGGSAVETKKKTLKKSKNLTWAKEKPQDPFEMLDKLPEEKQQEIQRALHLFSLGQGPPRTLQEARRHTFRFWATQPVPGIDEEVTSCGPVAPETASVREEPYSLPKGFTWDTLDLGNSNQLRELCVLLNENYTEEDDNTLRLHFTSELLLWALCPPGWQAQWHCGVRVHANRKLVGFIGAVPATVQIYDTRRRMAEVNFLCVHKRLRSKRMAPALIREITRRVQLLGTHQAVYSTTAVLPKPVADCRYWHRSLNPRKLVELNVSSLRGNMTLQRALKLNRLPKSPTTAGLRPMTAGDVEAVQTLLQDYMSRFYLRFILSLEEVEHWLLPRDEVIDTYVVESPGGQVTGLVSFYTLSSAVLNHSVHQSLKAAHCFYHVSTVTPLQQLMEDALIIAKAKGFDVFTALDVMENKSFLEPLRFSAGDRRLQYYFYNWKCPSLTPDKVGVVLK